jgi:hypothetical protein
MKWTRLAFFLLMFAGFSAPAPGKEVVIVTSFPKELFETYKKAFEAKIWEWFFRTTPSGPT